MADGKKPRKLLLLLLAATSCLLTLGLLEIVARVWVAARWPDDRVKELTTHSPTRGRFTSHAYLPFALTPGFEGHNSLGFRGDEITVEKPAQTRRLACLGASTTYGLHVTPAEAWPGQLCARLRASHGSWDVLNAGVPGWVSTETLVNFVLRVLPMKPDVVVLYQGRNELFPQAYNGFKADYSHYRNPNFNYTVSNYGHKLVFSYSRLAMLLCTVRGARFGWSELEEHPLFGGLMRENRPSVQEAIENLADERRSAALRRNLETLCAICKSRGITLVLTTMAFRPERLAVAAELGDDPALRQPLAAQLAENNDVMRSVAREQGVPLVDTATLSERQDLFLDDCHLTAEGHAARADMVFEVLASRLRR